jgi:6-phosphogluconolactonase
MKLKIFKNMNELSDSFCEQFSLLISEKEKAFVSLSGGPTPKLLYQALAEYSGNPIDWNKIHFFWGDERCVPADHPESNFGMAEENLLKNINIPEKNVHRIIGENNPAYEAERYSEEIKNNLSEANQVPQFDIMLLGLGEDGHTASIFPDQLHILSSEKICETAVHPVTKQKRITLTGKIINNSKKIFMIISGNNKMEIINKIINKADGYEKYPASFIKKASLEVYINTEEDTGI